MARRRKGLSDRHKKILEILEHFQNEVGYPPSIREIGEQANISSTSVVNYYLNQLEEDGFIERDKKISRGIKLIKTLSGAVADTIRDIKTGVENLVRIPMAGRIGAGIVVAPPSAADFSIFSPDEGIEVASSLLPARDRQDLFALEVQGESMIDAMVNDGDIVIMKPAQTAANGEMVAVRLTDEDETTLKYFYKEGSGIRLQPANPTMEPIMIDRPETVQVQGKVVMVIRKMEKLL